MKNICEQSQSSQYEVKQIVYTGNFKDGEQFGSGSMVVGGNVTYSSDSWTDSKNFTKGKEVRVTNSGIENYSGHYSELNCSPSLKFPV